MPMKPKITRMPILTMAMMLDTRTESSMPFTPMYTMTQHIATAIIA